MSHEKPVFPSNIVTGPGGGIVVNPKSREIRDAMPSCEVSGPGERWNGIPTLLVPFEQSMVRFRDAAMAFGANQTNYEDVVQAANDVRKEVSRLAFVDSPLEPDDES